MSRFFGLDSRRACAAYVLARILRKPFWNRACQQAREHPQGASQKNRQRRLFPCTVAIAKAFLTRIGVHRWLSFFRTADPRNAHRNWVLLDHQQFSASLSVDFFDLN